MESRTIKLRAIEARLKDVGRGRIRMADEAMKQIGVTPGDIVEIQDVTKGRRTAAVVWMAFKDDQDQKIVRIDGITRGNLKIRTNDMVLLRKADFKIAESVILAPLVELSIDSTLIKFIKQKLLGYPVTGGDQVRVQWIGQGLHYVVQRTTPEKSIVIVTDTTHLKIMEKAVLDDRKGKINYEDIGGLDDAIQRIREMIELPLRHPELFKRLGISPPKGVLLHGPPGCGKTMIAKAVAGETDANFISIAGPEIMSKFYGECVVGDSLVITNGTGLNSISEAVRSNNVHFTTGLNFKTGEIGLLPVKTIFDKGVQDTLNIQTPHGCIELTPSSRLLVLCDGVPTWIFADELSVGDQIAAAREINIRNTKIPLLLSYLPDKTLIGGDLVKKLFNQASGYRKNNIIAEKLGIDQRKYERLKYGGRKVPAKYLKVLFSLFPEKEQSQLFLTKERKVPLYMTADLMYIIGILSGDGHLRYSHVAGTVTQVILTTKDKAIRKRYAKAVESTFNILLKSNPEYEESVYFDSRPIGDLINNLGVPYSQKSSTVKVPAYVLMLPDDMLGAYLQGLFDADGGIQFTSKSSKKGRAIQISYYSKSKKLVEGIRLCILRFGVLSTWGSQTKDGIWRISITDINSLDRFRKYIGFTHEKKSRILNQESETAYVSPNYDRIPVSRWIYEIGKELGITQRELLQNGINPAVKGLTPEQLQKASEILSNKGTSSANLDRIKKLLDMKIIWTPIRKIEKGKAKVYDFEVPEDHNFVANGLIVHNSEARLRDMFTEAKKSSPSIIFIDEIDAIAPKREEVTGEVERRVVAQILSLMDGLEGRGNVIVVGATNRANALDPALRRPGRFDREISITVPSAKERLEILQIHTRTMPGIDKVDLKKISEITHGFVGADLAALAREAAMKTLREFLPQILMPETASISPRLLSSLKVTMEHFMEALKEVQPSAIREVFIETPDVKWSDIGGLDEAKRELIESVEWPIKERENLKRLGIIPPRGILLFGPPGTGKTLLAKAVANKCEANFISVKGPELVSKWVGESEKAIRETFKKARMASPAIIFFDEIESIASNRSSTDTTMSNQRIISQLLTELDGMEPLQNIVIVAATNRPDLIDRALLRPGRFDRIVFIKAPDEKSRLKIFRIHSKEMPLADDVDFERLAKITENYVGSDIALICREAGMLALRDDPAIKSISMKYFTAALEKIHATVDDRLLAFYEQLHKEFKKKGSIHADTKIDTFYG